MYGVCLCAGLFAQHSICEIHPSYVELYVIYSHFWKIIIYYSLFIHSIVYGHLLISSLLPLKADSCEHLDSGLLLNMGQLGPDAGEISLELEFMN